MALQRTQPKKASRDQIIAYIQDILFRGKTKTQSYKDNINDEIKDVFPAIKSLENREDFKAIYNVLDSDGNLAAQTTALKVRNKYIKLIEKNLDTAAEVLDEAETIKDKATAVRLVNETVGALAPIASGSPEGHAGGGGKLKRGGAVIEQ